MNLLLDTHALLWWLDGSPKLGRRAHDLIANPRSSVWVSAATAWEIAIKVALKRLTMREPPEVSLPREMEALGFHALPVSVPHALGVRTLPGHHADPFDRLLVAQAQMEALTIVTADDVFARYGVPVIDAEV